MGEGEGGVEGIVVGLDLVEVPADELLQALLPLTGDAVDLPLGALPHTLLGGGDEPLAFQAVEGLVEGAHGELDVLVHGPGADELEDLVAVLRPLGKYPQDHELVVIAHRFLRGTV